jgi:hypothetical protein
MQARAAIRGRLSAEQKARWDQVLREMNKDSTRADGR